VQEEKNWQGVDICWIGNGALHAKTYEALEKVKTFFYAHSVTDADRENILGLKKVIFSIEAKFFQEAKDNVRLFFLLKKVVFCINRSPYSLFVFSTPLKNDRSRFYCILEGYMKLLYFISID
jgi:hypothetical protein